MDVCTGTFFSSIIDSKSSPTYKYVGSSPLILSFFDPTLERIYGRLEFTFGPIFYAMAMLNCSKTMQASIIFTAIISLALFSYLISQTRAPTLGLNYFCRESCLRISNSAPGPITLTFERINALEDLSEDGDIAWLKQTSTSKGGFLRVRRNETMIENWGITVFHALHCLGIIHDALRSLDHQSDSGMKRGQPSHRHSLDTEHTLHCLSYLVQV